MPIMTDHGDSDDDCRPPHLKVVSDNSNAHADRQNAWAKQEVKRTLAGFAAAMLRTMAGSDTEAIYLIRRLSDFVDALNEFRNASGRGLTAVELEEMLRLPRTDKDFSHLDEWAYRHWLREHGLDVIVQGALRLAAHRVLGERPHFGGKYSKDVINHGIKTLEELKRPFKVRRIDPAPKGDDTDLGTSPQGDSPPKKASTNASGHATTKRRGFDHEDLKELRKAIKARDDKRIAELTAKIGRPSFEDPK
jgi:hypothetical protein